MSNRIQITSGEYYHIFNRGVEKRDIFLDSRDMERFFKCMTEFNSVEPVGSLYLVSRSFRGSTPKKPKHSSGKKSPDRLVDFIAYCLNPNHYHFILTPLTKNGVSEFMKRLSGGYTTYFNLKYKRSGVLFQGRYKAVHVESNEQLLHLSAYVNLNNRFRGSTPKLSRSSWNEYLSKELGKEGEPICNKGIVLSQFSTLAEYKTFALSALETILEKKKRDSQDNEDSIDFTSLGIEPIEPIMLKT